MLRRQQSGRWKALCPSSDKAMERKTGGEEESRRRVGGRRQDIHGCEDASEQQWRRGSPISDSRPRGNGTSSCPYLMTGTGAGVAERSGIDCKSLSLSLLCICSPATAHVPMPIAPNFVGLGHQKRRNWNRQHYTGSEKLTEPRLQFQVCKGQPLVAVTVVEGGKMHEDPRTTPAKKGERGKSSALYGTVW